MSGAAPTGHGSKCLPDLTAAVVRASAERTQERMPRCTPLTLHGSVVRVPLSGARCAGARGTRPSVLDSSCVVRWSPLCLCCCAVRWNPRCIQSGIRGCLCVVCYAC